MQRDKVLAVSFHKLWQTGTLVYSTTTTAHPYLQIGLEFKALPVSKRGECRLLILPVNILSIN